MSWSSSWVGDESRGDSDWQIALCSLVCPADRLLAGGILSVLEEKIGGHAIVRITAFAVIAVWAGDDSLGLVAAG